MGMNAGKLDRRVQLLRFNPTSPDGRGGQEGTYSPLGYPIAAARTDVKDAERWVAGRQQGELMTRFFMRSSAFTRAIKRSDRLICDGFEFEITGIKEIGRRLWIEITAEARF